MNPLELADKHLGEYRVDGDEIQVKYCPFCGGGKNHDKWNFSLNMNPSKMTYNCRRGKCGVVGPFFKLCHHFGEQADSEIEYRRNHKMNNGKQKPITPTKELPKKKVLKRVEYSDISPKIESYFKLRGITRDTLIKLNVKESGGNIVFIYTENGKEVLYKFKFPGKPKPGQKKAWQSGGGKVILWGLDDCDPSKPLVIVEGEPDRCIVYQSGYTNVVSVPFGTADMSWVENCWDELEKFKTIIMWGDNDPINPDTGVRAGEKMVKLAIARLGENRCKVVSCDYKDANVMHYKEGPEAVLQAIEEADYLPISDMIDFADIEEFNPDALEKIPTGFNQLDRVVGGLVLSTVTVLTGKSGAGKSTVINTMIATSVENEKPVAIYSGELKASFLKYWLELVTAGPNNVKTKQNGNDEPDSYYVERDTRNRIREWYRGRLHVYDNAGDNGAYAVLDRFTACAQRFGTKLFILDNLMTLKFKCSKDDESKAHSDFIQDLAKFAKKFDVAVVLIHHPRKTNGWMRAEDLKGTGDIFNSADTVIALHRVREDDAKDNGALRVGENMVEVLKNRLFSIIDTIFAYQFDIASKRFFNSKTKLNINYSWDEDPQIDMWEQEGFEEIEDDIPF